MEPIKKTPVGTPIRKSTDGQHTLFKQDIYGENKQIGDVFEFLEAQKEQIEQLELFPLEKRLPLAAGERPRVLLVYPTTKKLKQDPLRGWAQPQINAFFEKHGIFGEVDYAEEKAFDVPDTGVGSQPYAPKGLVGALNRTQYCQDQIKDEAHQYHAIFILSLESDFSEHNISEKDSVAYDAPNLVAFECFTGVVAAGRGRGPAAQKELLAMAVEEGFIDEEKLCGNRTYGDILARLFELTSSAWQEKVCGTSREKLINDLLDAVEIEFQPKNLLPQPTGPRP